MARDRGFTLIETMIVLVVAGIVLSFGMPAFSNWQNDMKLKQAHAQLESDLAMARQLAVTRRARVYVVFPSASNVSTYKIHIDKNSNGVIDSGEPVVYRTMPRSTTISTVSMTPTDSVVFDLSGILVLGSSTPGGTLIIKNQKSRYDTLAVSSAGIIYRP